MDTPGLSRANRYAQYARRSCSAFQEGIITSRIDMGTNTRGFWPSVVPSKPRGATPTIVIACPFTVSVSSRTPGSLSNLVRQ